MCSFNQKRVADRLTCSRLAVQCRDKDDMIYWNAVKAGEYDTWEIKCSDLIDSIEDLTWKTLSDNMFPEIKTDALLPIMDKWYDVEQVTERLGKSLKMRVMPYA